MLLDPEALVMLKSGASDLLGLGTGRTPRSPGFVATTEEERKEIEGGWKLVRQYIHSQNDRIVHFSAEVNEVLGNLPIKRYVIVTENALYRIPHSTIDTGIFFDSRSSLDGITQVITQDAKLNESELDAQVQCYFGETTTKSVTAYAQSPTAAMTVQTNKPFCTLSFGTLPSRRKAFLLALCAAHPTISILQKRHIPEAEENVIRTSTGKVVRKIKSPKTGSSPAAAAARHQDPASPAAVGRVDRKLTLQSHTPTGRSPTNKSAPAPSSSPIAQASTNYDSPALAQDIPDQDFKAMQELLRNSLSETSAVGISTYDDEEAARRPPEEHESRQTEREKIKAELESREAKIAQNIHFKVKYPQKVPTRVPPGVEFDKAQEQRLVLPDDFTDEELLGPSLYPLWQCWKATGGLLGVDGVPTDWTLYDSQDLIDSLKGREEVLFGVVGRLSLRRIAQMCELVDRERQMFLNKKAFHEREAQREEEFMAEAGGSGEDGSSENYQTPSPARTTKSSSKSPHLRGVPDARPRETTKVQPFRLSHSPTALRKLKLIDSKKLVQEMKKNFEKHMKAMHMLQKDQLESQLQRVRASSED